MTFRILDFAHKMHVTENINTQVTFACPVCGGKLKVRKANQAYKCYTNNCSVLDIKKAIGVASQLESEYIYKPAVSETEFPQRVRLWQLTMPYNLPEVRGNKIIYHYNANALVERIEATETTAKRFYPKHRNKAGNWIWGDSPLHGWYNQEQLIVRQNANVLFIVEGEKTASAFCSNTHWLALSPPGFGWSEIWLKLNLLKLVPVIDAVIYVPDNDSPGAAKAKLIQQCCWRVNLGCLILNLDNYYEHPGDDIADLIDRKLDVKEILQERLWKNNILLF